MKRFLLFIIAVLTISGCESDPNGGDVVLPPDLDFSLSSDSVTVPAEGGRYTVEVASIGDWSLSGGADWCVPSQMEGTGNEEVVVLVAPNDDDKERNATFIFTCGDVNARYTVIQIYAGSLTVTNTKYQVESLACRLEVEVRSDSSCDFDISDVC